VVRPGLARPAHRQRYAGRDRALTAAHMWLPFATRARVANKQNGRSVDVVVTDRGPYHEGRIIDLSAKAAELLGIIQTGTAEVTVTARRLPSIGLATRWARLTSVIGGAKLFISKFPLSVNF
jgi:rare lipoprotein A